MLSLLALASLLAQVPETAPHASYVTVVMMENRDYASIVGDPAAPYFNHTLAPQGVLLRNSHAVAHPSEPNYLAIFSGSTHGIASDACPLRFAGRNLASELIDAGKTFAGWSESMPRTGFTGCYAGNYARKHVPWVNFTNVPAADNRVYAGLPAVPMATVNFVIPNLCDDMHDCSTRHGDEWLARNLPPLISWNAANDGLLIVTWDEADPDTGTNHIATVLVGPTVQPHRSSAQYVDHYGVLRTIETIFGLPCIDLDCRAAAITGIWR
jgi:hypothetical protein